MVYCENKGVNCFWVHNDNLSEDDQKKFGQKQSVIDLTVCANYASNAGCHTKPSGPDQIANHQNWNEIELANDWISTDFKIKPISIGFEELDQKRCRKFKQQNVSQLLN